MCTYAHARHRARSCFLYLSCPPASVLHPLQRSKTLPCRSINQPSSASSAPTAAASPHSSNSSLGSSNPPQAKYMSLGESPAAARKAGLVGYLPQHIQSHRDWPLSVQQVVELGCTSKLKPWQRLSAQDQQAIRNAIEFVEMQELIDRPHRRTLRGTTPTRDDRSRDRLSTQTFDPR